MKKRLIQWSLILSLLLSLVPTAVWATGTKSTAEQLYKWEPTAAFDNIEEVTHNSNKTKTETLAVKTAQGTQSYHTYFLSAEADDLPNRSVTVGSTEKKVATEGLKLSFTNGVSISTAGKGAVNLSFVYAVTPNNTDTNVFALDKLKVQASTDGGANWLGEVGMRSWELLGSAKGQDGNAVYFFRIETENLLGVGGLKAGDTVDGIRIMPYGDFYYSFGYFGFAEVVVNGYTTSTAFDAAVPNERNDLLDIGASTMRDIVVQHALMVANVPWTTDTEITTSYSYQGAGSGTSTYSPGVNYRGPMYNQNIKAGYEVWRESIQDGSYVGGLNDGSDDSAVAGMDCGTFAYDAYSRVSRSYSYITWQTQSDNALQILGDLETTTAPVFTDTDIVDLDANTDEEIYAAYGLLQKGDLLMHYTTAGAIHVRIVQNVDPEDKTVTCIEQGSTVKYYDASGNEVSAGSAQFASSTRQQEYTFDELLEKSYVPFTLKEYADGKVENVDVQMILQPKDYKDINSGFRAIAAADYHVARMRVVLKDESGAEMYTDELLSNGSSNGQPRQYNHCWTYDSSVLDAKLAGLADGTYSIDVSLQTGPVTQAKADRAYQTQTYEFTVEQGHSFSHDHGENSDWKPLSEYLDNTTPGANNTQLSGGKYYLDQDIELTSEQKYLNAVGDVVLCLNGHTLQLAEDSAQTYVLRVNAGCELDICDCKETGCVTYNRTEAMTTTKGAVVIPSNGTVNLYGGTVDGGVSISGGTAGMGTFNMYGGTIKARGTNAVVYGHSSGAYVNIYGGDFEGLDGAEAEFVLEAPTKAERVVAVDMYGTTTNVTANVTYALYKATNGQYVLDMPGTKHVHAFGCDHAHVGSGDWKPLSEYLANTTPGASNTQLSGGKYYLDRDITLTAAQKYLNVSGDVTLCLNGHSLTGLAGQGYLLRFGVSGITIDICDCSTNESGKLGAGWTGGTATGNSVVYVQLNGTLNLYGGSISGSSVHTTVWVGRTGTFNMMGGSISGNTASNGIVNVSAASGTTAAGTFNMSGGVISDNIIPESKTIVVGAGIYNKTGGTVASHAHAACDHSHVATGDWKPLGKALSTITPSNNILVLPAGRYFLEEDVTLTGGWLQPGGDVAICLNGHKLIGEDGQKYVARVVRNRTLDICDCVGDGSLGHAEVTGAALITEKNGDTYKTAAVHLYAGSITGVTAPNVMLAASDCGFSMMGGAISGNTLTGAAIYLSGTNSYFNMSDGTVYGTIYRADTEASKITLSGGKFNKSLGAAWLATDDAYIIKDIAEGDLKYQVVPGFADDGGAHVDFKSSLNMSLFLAGDNGIGVDDSYTVTLTTNNGKKYTHAVGDITLSEGAVSAAAVTIQGIAAKEMRDAITVTVTKGGLTYYTDTLSVYEVTKAWYDAAEAGAYKTMLADVLNYGTEAQKVFAYGTPDGETLAGSTEDPVWTAVQGSGVSGGNGNKVQYTLSLKDKIQLNVYINDENAAISNVTFKGNSYSAYTRTTPTLTSTDGTQSKTVTLVSFGEINVVDADEQVSFTVTPSDGSEAFTVTYSIRDYVVDALGKNQDAVLKALQKYVDSVSAYISANS